MWDLWLSLYPAMMTGKLNFIGFEEFKKKSVKKKETKQVSKKSLDEIAAEMDNIVALYKGR